MTNWIPTVAKAITAAVAVVVAASVAGTIDLEPWIETALVAVVALLGVWAVPNKVSG